MRFDQVRREFKKTLWGEELDNERDHNTPAASAVELGFLHQYEGKKYRCVYCLKEYQERDSVFTNQGPSCTKCYQRRFNIEG